MLLMTLVSSPLSTTYVRASVVATFLLLTPYEGIDMDLAADVITAAKSFFDLPKEKKLEVCTDLMPREYCGYHPMQHYNPNGWKKRG